MYEVIAGLRKRAEDKMGPNAINGDARKWSPSENDPPMKMENDPPYFILVKIENGK